jgi:arabinan endo-1,5-alpha-L-arabinosidase
MSSRPARQNPVSVPLLAVARTNGAERLFELSRGSQARSYRLADNSQDSYLDFFDRAARDFGLRPPSGREPFAPPPASGALTPLLTRPISPDILYGYGDPCVTRAIDPETGRAAWWLVATSNDAPDAFPILRSDDLKQWRADGFVFPRGQTPAWALTGLGQADFWAPELHRVGAEYWVCFTARRRDRELAIGLARAAAPRGPFVADPEPLLGGGVIDPHILVTADGRRLLFWKEDTNGVWPRLLAGFLAQDPPLVEILFPAEPDRRTAALAAALWPWAAGLEPMEQFCLLQPLIEAVTEDYAAFTGRLAGAALSTPERAVALGPAIAALKTRVFAQSLSADGRRLEGQRNLIVENDQTWEAHLIEGVWVHEHAGRFYLFYSGNDFSTRHYGVGAAVATDPLGPYVKTPPLLRSSAEWVGPGHPSVAPGPDGEPWLFLHAFPPGQLGYKAFRALLMAKLAFGPDGPSVVDGED